MRKVTALFQLRAKIVDRHAADHSAVRVGDRLLAPHLAFRRNQAQILELFGTVEFDPKYDYKKQRRKA
jgi:hypothetical protein